MAGCSVGSVRARLASAVMSLGLGGYGAAYVVGQLTVAATSGRTSAVAFLLGAAVAVPRSFMVGASVDASGLTIRNYFRTDSIAWNDVDVVGWDRVSLGRHKAVTAPVLAVRLRSGRTVKARGTYGLLAVGRERLVAGVERYAAENGTRVELTADDLYFGLRRIERPHRALTDLAQQS